MLNKPTVLLISFLALVGSCLGYYSVQANMINTLTTNCVNAPSFQADMLILRSDGSIFLPNTSMLPLGNDVYALNVTFTQLGEFTTRETCHFNNSQIVTGGDIIQVVNSTDINITVTNNVNLTGNFSDLNASITAAIAQPRTYDFNTFLLIIFILFLVVLIFYHAPGYILLVAIYTIIYAIILWISFSSWLGIIILALGGILGYYGFRKM